MAEWIHHKQRNSDFITVCRGLSRQCTGQSRSFRILVSTAKTIVLSNQWLSSWLPWICRLFPVSSCSSVAFSSKQDSSNPHYPLPGTNTPPFISALTRGFTWTSGRHAETFCWMKQPLNNVAEPIQLENSTEALNDMAVKTVWFNKTWKLREDARKEKRKGTREGSK